MIKWVTKLFEEEYKKIQRSNDEVYIYLLNVKKDIIKSNIVKIDDLNNQNLLLQDRIVKLEEVKKEECKLEKFWNNKRRKSNTLTYPARPVFNSSRRINVDPRGFFVNDKFIPYIKNGTNDEKAKECLKWVIDNIKYKTDINLFKRPEVWLFPFETLSLGKGDCEDGGILMANMMIKSGIPYWRIRINAGDVKGTGHAYITYLREKDNKWVILDWCYYPKNSLRGLLWKKASKYYFGIWFSFNQEYIFKGATLDR